MRYKIVTGYWMDIENKPYAGMSPVRKDRYLGSIISHCRGFQCEVVCYTHERNLEELQTIKSDYNLGNLTIKIRELHDVKYSPEIRRIEGIKTAEELSHLNGRPPEVLWGKFDVLRDEATTDVDFVYWVDAGFQSNQIFPYKYCPEITESVRSLNDLPEELFRVPFKQYNFTKIFNRDILNRLATITKDKIVVLVSNDLQCSYHNFEKYTHKLGNFPIAGFFGGDREVVKQFCDKFTEGVNLYTSHNILDFEQSIMKYALDEFPEDKLLLYKFVTHQGGIPPEVFHIQGWAPESGYPKPIYAIWEEILKG
jgi:hypothetical protein